ncbi:MAG: PspC domain-containing protein [Eubacterium sp.]
MKKLYRSKTERRISGVCGGIAKWMGIDVSLVRILWVIISLATTGIPGTLVYIVCALIIPEEPDYMEFDMK